jgi:nucleoid DNA-binding protein
MLNKKEFIANISKSSGLNKKEIARIISSMPKSLAEVLINNEKVTISGFGTFRLSKRKSRIGTNPRTKEKINLPASVSVNFKPSGKFKNQIQN